MAIKYQHKNDNSIEKSFVELQKEFTDLRYSDDEFARDYANHEINQWINRNYNQIEFNESDSIQEVLPIFPNGFDSWQESHYDISTAIGDALAFDGENEALKIDQEIGTGGIYDLAKELTFKFESENKDVNWGDEKIYYDTMEEFIKKEIFTLK